MFSHKRKHERHDSEQAYQKYKLAQKTENAGSADADGSDGTGMIESPASNAKHLFGNNLTTLLTNYAENATKMESLLHGSDSFNILQQLHLQKQAMLGEQSTSSFGDRGSGANSENGDDSMTVDNNNYDAADSVASKPFGQNEQATDSRPINPNDLEQLKHIYSAMEKAKQKQINALLFAQNNFNSVDQSEPLNLNLSAVVQKMQNQTQNAPTNLQQITSIDGLFNRKRGRPPKNRVVEVYGNVSTARPKYTHVA